MTFDLDDLARRSLELRNRLMSGEEVEVTYNGEQIGRFVPAPPERPPAPQRIGFAKGSFPWMAPDFDDPLPDEFWLGDDKFWLGEGQ